VNVHKEEAETFTWMIHEEAPALATFTGMKAFTVQGELYVFGSTSDGKTMVYSSVDGDNWEKHSEINDAESYANTVVLQEDFYTIVGGKLFKSSDATEWEEVNGTLDINQLVASSYSDLYGLTADGYLLVSDDYGVSWTEDKLDSDVSWLPITGISAVCYPANMTYYADYVVMAGISSGVDKIASVWRKIVEYDLQGDEKWVYMSRSDNNLYALPLMGNLVMMAYDDGILAWGVKDDAYTQIYQSRDNGITWKLNPLYYLPEDFDRMLTTKVHATVDDENFIWLYCEGSGQVWRGRLNRLGWERK
jgi:hypothetical protein